LRVKGILVIELPDGKGEWPGGAAALFNVPEKMAAAKDQGAFILPRNALIAEIRRQLSILKMRPQTTT